MQALALAILALTSLYLIGLGALALLRRQQAGRFLLGFASSPATHVLEMGIRLAVGASCLIAAPRLLHPGAFQLLGWLLIATSAVLLLLPWRWHQGFAAQAVPRALRFVGLIGVASLLLGALLGLALLQAVLAPA